MCGFFCFLNTLKESTQALRKGTEVKEMPNEMSHSTTATLLPRFPLDSSNSSESDEDKTQASQENQPLAVPVICPMKHDGRKLLSEIFPLAIDDLFTLIFTYNKFNMELLMGMKYTDVKVSNWEENSDGLKMRTVNLVVPMSQPVGPKTCQVTEKQVMQGCSKPGDLYVIEVEAVNAGVPYCDSFYINTHFCLTRISKNEASCTVHCQIKYRKSVWGLVKTFIEKNVWAGLDDFYKSLGKALEEETIRKPSVVGVDAMRSQKREIYKVASAPESEPTLAALIPTASPLSSISNDLALRVILGVLAVLVFLNVILYYKLSAMEDFDKETKLSSIIDSQVLSEERSHDQWISLLRKQTNQHQREIQEWKVTLKSIVSTLKQAEESLLSLQSNIQTVVRERVIEALKPLPGLDGTTLKDKHDEL